MKAEKCFTGLTAFALAFALSLGGIGCLITGFDLTVRSSAGLAAGCALAALAGCLLLWKRGGLLLSCGLALGAGYLWHQGSFFFQLAGLLETVSSVYDRAYHWGYLQLTVEQPETAFADQPLLVLGILLALLVCRAVCRGKGTWLTSLAALFPLMLCLVVTDTVPTAGCLFALLTGLAILILTAGIRKESPFQANQLTAMAVLPVLLGMVLLFHLAPQESYVNHAIPLRRSLFTWAEDFPGMLQQTVGEFSARIQGAPQERVDLKNLGSRVDMSTPVMEVTTGISGPLYLRGQDYDIYTGTDWHSSPDRKETLVFSGSLSDTVTVTLKGAREILYFPYYPVGETVLTDGLVANPGNAREYSLARTLLPPETQIPQQSQEALPLSQELEHYTALPAGIRDKALSLLYGTLPETGSFTEKAAVIRDVVSHAARYDLTVSRMPQEETDFALWFLASCDRGYCIHFATAAAVLLRAADIPARYVTGYMVEARAGEPTTVTAGDAHAWVEYYEPALDTWLVLEATPSDAEEAEAPAPIPTQSATQPAEQVEETTLPPPTAAPEVPSSPQASPQAAPRRQMPEWVGNLLWAAALAVMAVLLAVTQRLLRLRLGQHLCQTGDANAMALARWQEVRKLAKLLKEPPPERLHSLAQKAKFSQHTLTDRELAAFDSYCQEAQQRLKALPWYYRLLHQYLFAAY